ncbi:ADP-ribose pyrophosphatase [Kribbella antiqua]|uniref:ADP-ribose pyrophosphatase n=1 Tax=Kribbella antiqua TaxID=2512217 RepID=A0A4R2IXJ6_9ACTN|nr:NUDIX hydrolase [Kribbella antiqua]TCO50087.1 ADP-ribose pyrophosphatase [Kribbella antiqua]
MNDSVVGSAAADSAAAASSRPGDPEPWVLLDEEPGFNRFLTVNLRRYRLPDGREVEWDVFGPKSADGITSGITVLPITPEGRIVTIRMFRAGPDRVVTNLPGGLVEAGEDPAVAGARELEEETGYTCESLEVVGWQWSSASSIYRKYVAIARGCRPDGKQALDEFEDCVPVELTVDEFRTELRTPGAMTGIDASYLALDHAGLL